jgi:hypothetical protein
MTGATSLHFDRSCPEMLVPAWLASFTKHSRWFSLAIAAGNFILDPSARIEVIPRIKKPFESSTSSAQGARSAAWLHGQMPYFGVGQAKNRATCHRYNKPHRPLPSLVPRDKKCVSPRTSRFQIERSRYERL